MQSKVGVLGATSLVGESLLSRLVQTGCQVMAYSRREVSQNEADGVTWTRLPPKSLSSIHAAPPEGGKDIPLWICVAPIWVLPEYFALLEKHRVRRVVALSSTSLFTKDDSSDPEEQAVALRLAEAEARVQSWAKKNGVEWVILRPTLIYGLGQDKNIAEIARFIHRFGFFPLFGEARGLRQPIHAADVAAACVAALKSPVGTSRAYNISGGETLSYREMVGRVFASLHRQPRLVKIPLAAFQLAVLCLRMLPKYRHWSSAMAERMNHDLIFDHAEAARDLGFSPRPFRLESDDLP
ncbi:MAG: NAD-dependent epimerase/dehydratase family protein [Desulfobulbaceae bacterium]|nr:NAD-dependent epimerase/dehydratase family protein [Desulfobulbaceae bacterium]